MDNPRTLPPLVRGKVTGLLDFFIDEIILCKNILFLTKNLDITARLRWWGEVLPAYIRPKILQLQGKVRNSSQSIEAYSHSIQYEIKTSVDLFKSYLKACDIVELSVYEGFENYIIGSAFLKNLSNVLNRNNVSFSVPIIDYSGEEIGQMKIHTNFFQYPPNNKNHICKNEIDNSKLDSPGKEVSEKLKQNFLFPAGKATFFDDCSKITKLEVESDWNSELDLYSGKNKNSSCDVVLCNYESEIALKNHLTAEAKESSRCVTPPEVCVSKDPSKILNLGSKAKKPEKSNKSKLLDKFSSNSIHSKSKQKTEKSNLGTSTNKEKFPKKAALRNLSLPKPSVGVTDQLDLRLPSREQSSESFSHKNSELEISAETCTDKMVFDYLLGAAMTKESEERAMKNFKKMSPSHDIVCSINELCLTSGESKNKCIKSNLCFDLTNPIERNYYEKFFVKNNLVDFEIAELLNEPKNSCALQEPGLIDKNTVKGSLKAGNSSVDESLINKCDKLTLDNLSNVNKITSNCARCKYYKKLQELDTIIESLKHFEKNMIMQEKKLQLDFEKNLNKQGCKVSDR